MQAYSSLKEKYSRQASRYDRRWNRMYGHATLQATVEAVPWSDLQRVLDVGCGTGELLEVAGHGRLHPRIRVIGVDVSLPMLQQAHKKLNGARHASWSNAVAENLPFPGECFDAVVCANSFHY
ncbi:MAG: class I SAM-dependent methyltransferase, partial [Acidobacteria bacterium]|nr:class I SAM-dependent methyltransferase [Acidobacteriota bacterium]